MEDELRIEPAAISTPELRPQESPRAAAGGLDFARIVAEVVGETSRELNRAEEQARALAEGKGGLVETVLALNKADLSLRFVVELRNRFVEAYREITRISA